MIGKKEMPFLLKTLDILKKLWYNIFATQ